MNDLRLKHLFLVVFAACISFAATSQEVGIQDKDLSNHIPAQSVAKGGCAFFSIMPVNIEPTCNGFEDGEICVPEPLDGVGPFTYQWFNGPTGPCWSDIGTSTNTILITDLGQVGAVCDFEIMLFEPSALGIFDMVTTPPSCANTCDGQSSPIAIGGNGGNQFTWSSGENTPAATMLCNPFTLHIEDVNGCSTDTTFVFDDAPPAIEVTGVVSDVICAGAADGGIDVTAIGGAGGSMFEWTSPGPPPLSETTEDLSGIPAGEYQLIVEDVNGCMDTTFYTVLDAAPITIDAVVVDVLCFGDSTGSISLDVAGGNSDYVYNWTGPNSYSSMDEDIMDLKAGDYFLSITDMELCVKDTMFTVNETAEIDVTATIVNADCFGATTGSIVLNATSSVAGDLSFEWTLNGSVISTEKDIIDLEPEIYCVTVTDANFCSKDTCFEVTSPDEILFDLIVTDILCNGDSTGSIEMELSGGAGGFSQSWDWA